MNITSQKQFAVIIAGKTKRILSSKELDNLYLDRLLFSEDIKIKFYDKLPCGIYEFKRLKIDVDKLGDINIIGQIKK